MTGLALALAAGAALPPAGVDVFPAALILLAAAVRPNGPRARPAGAPRARVDLRRLGLRWLPLAALAGLLHGTVSTRLALRDCRWVRPSGAIEVAGWIREVEATDRVVVRVTGGNCGGDLRAQGRALRGPPTPAGGGAGAPSSAREGVGVRLRGRWIPRGPARPGQDPLRAGILLVRSIEADPAAAAGLGAALARVRAEGVDRVARRFHREGALVAALVFARRDGLAPGLREAFTATGTAHLLAISGFHVGVLAGAVIWLAGRVVPPRRAVVWAAAAAWVYVAVLGLPDAATRAALLLSLAGVGRAVGRPVSAAGALGTALAALVVLDPGVAGRVGAQLSFAGALGLAVWARPWTRRAVSAWTRRRGETPAPRTRALMEAGVVTVVASLATLPFVAWHFERVSTVAVPASLGATPLVALALPAVLLALLLDAVHLPGAALAATGAEGLLGAARLWVETWAAVPGASWALARPDVAAAGIGAVVGWAIVRSRLGVGVAVRGVVVAVGVAAGLIAWPVSRQVLRNGSLEVHMFDVGQGDAFGLRTPGGRWVVVDAGPPSGRRLAAELRRAGAPRIDLLLLSHPDADHVGGAATLLRAFEVGAVAGPGTVRGAGPWRDAVAEARRRAVPWHLLGRGDSLAVDGVSFRVVHPPSGEAGPREPNEASLVVEVVWRGVSILFTGDAPTSVEEAIVGDVAGVDVLKVGHHGSATSSEADFLDAIGARLALVSVGRGNRYGHPDAGVLARLRDRGVEVWRTDVRGAVTVRVDPTGRWTVSARR